MKFASFNASGRNAWALLLGLIAAGLAGNYFKYPIFLNIDFLFGSIFAMLALQLFGPARGIVAAALMASVTYSIWWHPYAIVILTAEAAAVAWLTSRRHIGWVLADALYWLLVGMPLVYLFYHHVMAVPLGNIAIIMTKQAVNGIANALLARLIFTVIAIRWRTALVTYRELIYNLLATFALFPVLALLMVASRADFRQTDHSIRTQLQLNSRNMTQRLETWVLNRSIAIIQLAELAGTRAPEQMQTRLEMVHRNDVNFLRVGLLDQAATIVAYSPLLDELGQANVGRNFADRPFIPQLKQTLKPMLSEVVMGRIGTPKPIVTMLAPVVQQGHYAGYVTGILSLEQVRGYLESSTNSDTMLYTLLDKNGNIILSNRKEQKVMHPLVRGAGTLTPLDGQMAQWVHELPANTPISERWKLSFYVTESPVGSLAEWRLMLEQPVAPFQKMLYARYANALMLLLLMLVATLAVAEYLSRRVAARTEQLTAFTQQLPAKLEKGEQAVWPHSNLLEHVLLINTFQSMANSLAAQFSANRELNASLEQRVQERTHALEVSMLELKRSNADLEQFAYAASHDMRQPLRMIRSYLQLLEGELAPVLHDETRQNFQFAIEGAQRMDQMLAALLDYSRVGRQHELRVRVDLRTLLDAALHILRPAIEEAQAQVRVQGEWPQLRVNQEEILRLFQNLIDNAIKYRLPGRTPDVLVSAQQPAGRAEWCFSVRDNGVGLLPGQHERLFKVFERLQPRAKYPGTGIGLALCRKIVEHHNGRIWAESDGADLGCTFRFTLPGGTAAAPAPAAVESDLQQSQGQE
jgi:signal transduction histidine kinase